MIRKIFSAVALFAAFGCYAQTSLQEIEQNPLKAGGVYYAYPVSDANAMSLDQAPTPKGYEPFYVSHYGDRKSVV